MHFHFKINPFSSSHFPASSNSFPWSQQMQFWFVCTYTKHSSEGHYLSNSLYTSPAYSSLFQIYNLPLLPSLYFQEVAIFTYTFCISFNIPSLSDTNTSLHQALVIFLKSLADTKLSDGYKYQLIIPLHSPVFLLLLFYFAVLYSLVDKLSFALYSSNTEQK